MEYIRKQIHILQTSTDIRVDVRDESVEDRFVLLIPYCGKLFKWDILYNYANLSYPPDFIVDGDGIHENPISYERLQSTREYVYNEPASLLKLVTELMVQFEEHQKKLVYNYADERLSFELETIQSDKGVQYLLDRLADQTEIRISIPLGYDLVQELDHPVSILRNATSDKPNSDLPSKGPVTLLVTFRPSSSSDLIINGNHQNPFEARLVIPPLWDKSFAKLPKIPPLSHGTCLIDYMPQVKDILDTYISNLKTRRKFILQLINLVGQPLEYDPVLFYRATFLVVNPEGVSDSVFVTLHDLFPERAPSLTILSHNFIKGNPPRPVTITKDNVPFSPRWSAEEMARRMQGYLVEQLAEFNKLCKEENK